MRPAHLQIAIPLFNSCRSLAFVPLIVDQAGLRSGRPRRAPYCRNAAFRWAARPTAAVRLTRIFFLAGVDRSSSAAKPMGLDWLRLDRSLSDAGA
ncbi:hypothetical protein, partial [Bradyrhizobium sp.]|uniref:hypothetical protein n=1 Tax=Bradyrhizobium sp. TaxID=376 RepID=UPI0025B92F84